MSPIFLLLLLHLLDNISSFRYQVLIFEQNHVREESYFFGNIISLEILHAIQDLFLPVLEPILSNFTDKYILCKLILIHAQRLLN